METSFDPLRVAIDGLVLDPRAGCFLHRQECRLAPQPHWLALAASPRTG